MKRGLVDSGSAANLMFLSVNNGSRKNPESLDYANIDDKSSTVCFYFYIMMSPLRAIFVVNCFLILTHNNT
jgi:hypothetical protein